MCPPPLLSQVLSFKSVQSAKVYTTNVRYLYRGNKNKPIVALPIRLDLSLPIPTPDMKKQPENTRVPKTPMLLVSHSSQQKRKKITHLPAPPTVHPARPRLAKMERLIHHVGGNDSGAEMKVRALQTHSLNIQVLYVSTAFYSAHLRVYDET